MMPKKFLGLSGRQILPGLIFFLVFSACRIPSVISPQLAPVTATPTAIVQNKPPLLEITPSPTLSKLDDLLLNRCEKVWQRVTGLPVAYGLVERYGESGCKLSAFSPDGNFLAYVTLTEAQDKKIFVDTVKVLNVATDIEHVVRLAGTKNFIGQLEWSSTGKLIIWEQIWEGPWVIFIYDPETKAILNVMRLGLHTELEWNPTRLVAYASHSGEYGNAGCVTELNGYDFEHSAPFPDFYQIYGMETREDDPYGIPYGKNDNLAIDPYGWNADGNLLWITITPLREMDNGLYYERGPRQAAVLDFSSTRPKYTALGTDPNLDYSFEGQLDPKLISEPYKPQHCPQN